MREPIVVVTVQNHGGIVPDTRFGQQSLKRSLKGDIANHGIAELGVPGPGNRSGHVAFVIGLGIHVYFDHAHIRVFAVRRYPIGIH